MSIKPLRRALALLLAAGLLLGLLTGCSSSENGQRLTAELHVYKCETTDTNLDEMADNFSSTLFVGDKLYTYAYAYHDDTETSEEFLLRANLDGSGAERLPFTCMSGENKEDSAYISGILADPNGGLYVVQQLSVQGELLEEGWYDYISSYYLDRIDPESGESLSHIQLQLPEGQDWLNASYGVCLPDGTACFPLDTSVLIATPDGQCRTVELVTNGNGYVDRMFVLGDGTVVVHWYGGENWTSHYSPMDTATGKLGDDIVVPEEMRNANLISDPAGKMYFYDENGIYAFDDKAGTVTLLCNWLDSDIDYSREMDGLTACEDGTFLATSRGENWDKLLINRLSYVDPATLPEKTTLTLACTYSWQLQRAALRFNRASDTVRITLVDYSRYNNESNEYTGAVTQLNSDIITGRVPDILAVDSSLPFASYVAKGLFCDLYPLLDADETISRDDLVQSILKLCEVDGKLTSLIPYYQIATFAGKPETVGEAPGWTWEEFNALLAAHPEVEDAITFATRDTLVMYGVLLSGSQFVDYAAGACHFDSPAFTQLLEYAASYPADLAYENYDETELLRSGKALLSMASLYDFDAIRQTAYALDGDFTFKGFPTADGSVGSAVGADMQLAISSSCPDQAAAWQFLSYFLSEEYTESGYASGFPLNRALLQQMADDATNPENYANRRTYVSADGSRTTFYEESDADDPVEDVATDETDETTGDATDETATDDTTADDTATDDTATDETETGEADGEITVGSTGGGAVIIGGSDDYGEYDANDYWNRPITQAEVDKVLQAIDTAGALAQYDTNLMKIIEEEIAPFFEGTKSAEETAAVIQNRASTYLSESR